MTLKQGDIITHEVGHKREVHGVVGKAVLVSQIDDFERAADLTYTEKQLLELGYTFSKEKWTPEENEQYYGIDVVHHFWRNDSIDKRCRDGFFGIFKTEAEAKDRIALIEAKLKEI